ncbi:MAG: hypothetical protein RL011_818, partial [Pseudomonadota bacterium]
VLLVMLPYVLFVGVCGLATLRHRKVQNTAAPQVADIKFAVVIPAHNEGPAIRRTIESVQSVNYPLDHFRVVVIADNCDDDTAEIARAAGAFVLERSDNQRRSKGHALADTLPRIIEQSEFGEVQAIVIVDADTVVDRQVLRELHKFILAGCSWMQGLDVVANGLENWRTKLTAFGFALFNGSFQLGSQFITGDAHLRGNGMCFTREALGRFPWLAGGLAEDLEFSWKLRLAGERVQFVPTAIFWAEMPVSGRVSASQRKRWEKGRHGLWAELRGQVLRANVSAIKKILWAIDLTMPSFTSLVACYLLSVSLFIAGSLLQSGPIDPFNVGLLTVTGLSLASYTLSPFLRFGLPWATLSALVQLPYYVVWRAIIALGRTPSRWVRTERR